MSVNKKFPKKIILISFVETTQQHHREEKSLKLKDKKIGNKHRNNDKYAKERVR